MDKTGPIRVIAVDDHQVVRGGIKFALLDHDDIELVGEADGGEDAVRLCVQAQPDVVLMDMMMDGMDGVETTRAIREQCPQVQVLILSSFYDEDLVPHAMQAGAIGYLLKGVSNQELVEAIRAAHAGQPVLAKEAMAALVEAAAPGPKLGDDLSAREREVLALLAQGIVQQRDRRAPVPQCGHCQVPRPVAPLQARCQLTGRGRRPGLAAQYPSGIASSSLSNWIAIGPIPLDSRRATRA